MKVQLTIDSRGFGNIHLDDTALGNWAKGVNVLSEVGEPTLVTLQLQADEVQMNLDNPQLQVLLEKSDDYNAFKAGWEAAQKREDEECPMEPFDLGTAYRNWRRSL